MPAPAAPTLSTPAAAATGVGLSPEYAWTAASGATAYNVQVSLLADFSLLFASLQLAGLKTAFYPPLPPGGRVYWRVNAQNGSGISAWASGYFDTASPNFGLPFIPDHVARGKALILHQFQENAGNAPNLNALLATFLAEVQELENATVGVAVVRTIDAAWGAQLEILGKWVGLQRTDPDDDVYRAAIKLRWYENSSSAQTEQMEYIAQQLCGASAVKYEPADRAGFYSLLVTGGSIADPILANLQALSPLGVQLYALHRGALRQFHMGDTMTQALQHE